MKKIVLLCVLLSLNLFSSSHAGSWNYGGYISSTNFNSTVARQQGVENDALGLGLQAEYDSGGLFLTSMGFEILVYDDNNEFRQVVIVESPFSSDEVRTESSDAGAVLLFADAGPHWKFGSEGNSYIAVSGGFSTAVESDRSISSCVDCYDEDIDIDGGLYIKGSVSKGVGPIALGLQYLHFLDDEDGTKNSVRFTIGTNF